jgi:hypothetical protein
VVVEPEEIVAGDPRGHRMLYVALTRTTTNLDIVHVGEPLPGAGEPAAPEETSAAAGDMCAELLASLDANDNHERATKLTLAVPERAQLEPEPAVVVPPEPFVVTAPPPVRLASGNSLSQRVTELLAVEIAQQIRDSAPAALWAPVLDRVAALLDQAPPMDGP